MRRERTTVHVIFSDAPPGRLDARARTEEHARASAALRRRRRLSIPLMDGLANGERQVELLKRLLFSVLRGYVGAQERTSPGAGTGRQRVVIRIEITALQSIPISYLRGLQKEETYLLIEPTNVLRQSCRCRYPEMLHLLPREHERFLQRLVILRLVLHDNVAAHARSSPSSWPSRLLTS